MDVVEIIVRAVDAVSTFFPIGSGRDGGARRGLEKAPLPITTSHEAESRTYALEEDDNGRILDVHVSDRLLTTLAARPAPDITIRLVQPDAMKLRVFEDVTYGQWHHVGCRVVGMGDARIEVEYLRGDGSVCSTWSVDLRVTA